MTTEGTACPTSMDAGSCQSCSSPQLGSDPRAVGQTGSSWPIPGGAQHHHQEDGMEVQLATIFLPLLLLTWMPTGESLVASPLL